MKTFCMKVTFILTASSSLLRGSLPDLAGVPDEAIKNGLINAIQQGDARLAGHYLKNGGSKLKVLDQDGHTALHMACLANSESTVQEVIRESKVDFYQIDSDHETALHKAARSASPEVCKFLLYGQGSLDKVKLCNFYGGVLKCAAHKIGNAFSVSPLKRRNREGLTPLHLAVIRGHYGICEMLVKAKKGIVRSGDERGCDACYSEAGLSALDYASYYGRPDICQLLVSNGAQITLNTIEKAVASQNNAVLAFIASTLKNNLLNKKHLLVHLAEINTDEGNRAVQWLLDDNKIRGINLHAKYMNKAFSVALGNSNFQLVRLFLRAEPALGNHPLLPSTVGDVLFSQDNQKPDIFVEALGDMEINGESLLIYIYKMSAIYPKRSYVLKKLIEQHTRFRIDLTKCDICGNSLLHLAVYDIDVELCKLFVAAERRLLYLKNNDHKTPQDLLNELSVAQVNMRDSRLRAGEIAVIQEIVNPYVCAICDDGMRQYRGCPACLVKICDTCWERAMNGNPACPYCRRTLNQRLAGKRDLGLDQNAINAIHEDLEAYPHAHGELARGAQSDSSEDENGGNVNIPDDEGLDAEEGPFGFQIQQVAPQDEEGRNAIDALLNDPNWYDTIQNGVNEDRQRRDNENRILARLDELERVEQDQIGFEGDSSSEDGIDDLEDEN